jgi:FkbM family methyltransferase
MSFKRQIVDYCSTRLGYRIARKGFAGPILEIDVLERFLRDFEIDCVFDVGANEGQYASRLRQTVRFKGAIISFEPDPAVAAKLRERTRGDNLWFVEEIALDRVEKTAIFNAMNGSQFSSLRLPVNTETTVVRDKNQIARQFEVRTAVLSEVYSKWKVALNIQRPLLKLDTQGSDLDVVNGGMANMVDFVGIQSELAFKRLYKDAPDYYESITFYDSLGFELSALFPNNDGHFPRLLEMDCLLINRRFLTNG